MALPILQTKLVVPPLRPEVITRERLLKRLELGPSTKAMLVSAPAGFGKTTLISEWLQRLKAAWLSLDVEDNDLRRLLHHLLTAIHALSPPLGAAGLELLEGASAPAADGLLGPLLNEAADLDEPLLIVLDDYHLITNAEVHEAFDFLLEYAPPTVTLCILTRADPPLKLARLRARAQLIELRSDDLRFRDSESAAFLNAAAELGLSEQDAEALNKRAEGWAVGLQVMALSLTGRADGRALVDELTRNNRFLLDYLLDEVLARQPEHVQTFLLKTSVLDKLSAPLCYALLDPEDIPVHPAEMLLALERANLFLRPLDGERVWFRYHQLFKDVLFHHLSTTRPELVAPLRQSAAAWFQAKGYTLEALEQLLAGKLYQEAADLLAEIGPELLWRRGDAKTLEDWLARLPADVLGARPDLLILRAWGAHLLGRTELIGPLLDEAEALINVLDFGGSLPGSGALKAEAAALRGFVARMEGDFAQALKHSTAALADLPEQNYGLRSLVNGNLGEVYYLRGELVEAKKRHLERSQIAEKGGAVLPSRFALWRVSDIQMLRGELEEAKKTSHMMLNLNKLRSVDALGFADVQLGIIALEQNDLSEAEKRFSTGIELGHRLNNPRVFMPAYGPFAKALLALGRADEAQEVLSEGLDLATQHGVTETWGLPSLEAWQAYLDLRTDELEQAASWLTASGLRTKPHDLPFTRSFDALIAARVLLAEDEAVKALELLEHPTLKLARPVELDALRALALAAAGRKDESLDVLERALRLAAEDMHMFTFIDEGEPMQRLLRSLKDAGRQTAYANTLLAAFPKPETPRSEAPETQDVDDFNERELSVLRLMAGRLTNKEIARELDLSTNTIKWYAKGIFEKLEVHGRRKAASKAQELGLI